MKALKHNLSDEQVEDLAKKAHGFVGADLASLCDEAAYTCLRRVIRDSVSDEAEIWVSSWLLSCQYDQHLKSCTLFTGDVLYLITQIFLPRLSALGGVGPTSMTVKHSLSSSINGPLILGYPQVYACRQFALEKDAAIHEAENIAYVAMMLSGCQLD